MRTSERSIFSRYQVSTSVHGAAGLNDPLWRYALAQQVFACDITVWQINVADMIDNSAVNFFWNPLIEAPVSRFHVKDGNPQPFRGERSQAAVRVPQDQYGIGRDFTE